MSRIIARIVLRLAFGLALAAAAWWWSGPVLGMIALALLGALLAGPIVDLASELRHATRSAALRGLEGRHFEYHGRPIAVVEDADHRRWVRIDDVRRITGNPTSDRALELTYPEGIAWIGGQAHLADDALALHLAKETSPHALRFAHWAEREIAFPARRTRERLGIRLPAQPRMRRTSDVVE